MTAVIVIVGVLILLGTGWAFWARAGHRWSRLSTREREKRSRASFLFSEKGRRRPERSREVDRTSHEPSLLDPRRGETGS